MKKSGGITLIALVVTIIVLLILAGVSLNLISGSDGILGRATSAENTHDIANAKEQADLFVTDTLSAYYEEVYVDKTFSGSKLDYISDQIGNGVVIGDYFIKIVTGGTAKVEKIQAVASLNGAYSAAELLTELNIEVYKGNSTSGTKILEGTIDTDGVIHWNNEVSQNETENTTQVTITADPESQTASAVERQNVTITVTSNKKITSAAGKYVFTTSNTLEPTSEEWQTLTLNDATNDKEKTATVSTAENESGNYYLWIKVTANGKTETETFGPYKMQTTPTEEDFVCKITSKQNNDTTGTLQVGTKKAYDGWTFTYKINSGTEQTVTSGTTTTDTVKQGDKIVLKYSKAGSTAVTKEVTISELKIGYTLSYDANGGSGEPNAQPAYTNTGSATFTVSSTTPTRSGYTFDGWNTEPDGTGTDYSAGDSITITEDTTLYAKWVQLTAEMLEYTRTWGTTSITNVKQALDYLYNNY